MDTKNLKNCFSPEISSLEAIELAWWNRLWRKSEATRRQPLELVASVAKPNTILGWYRKLIARKFDGSKHHLYPGRPPVAQEITELNCPQWLAE